MSISRRRKVRYDKSMLSLFKTIAPTLRFGARSFVCLELGEKMWRATALHTRDESISKVDSSIYPQIASGLERAIPRPPNNQVHEALTYLLTPFTRFSYPEVAVLGDGRIVATRCTSTALLRELANEPISESELENSIAQGVWKAAMHEQSHFSRDLRIPELEVAIANANIEQIRLDGHRVKNPIGFPARTIELTLRLTSMSKTLLQEIRRVLPEDRIFILEEAGMLMARAHLDLASGHDLLFVFIDEQETSFFEKTETAGHSLDVVKWGYGMLYVALGRAFGISYEEAKAVLRSFCYGALSADLFQFIRKLLDEECGTLRQAILSRKTIPRERIVLLPLYEFPASLMPPYASSWRRFGEAIRVIDNESIGEHFGFRLNLQEEATRARLLSGLMAVVAFEKDDQERIFGRIAKQRARWLNK